MSSEELIAVMVPKKHLTKVYGFVAQLERWSTFRAARLAARGCSRFHKRRHGGFGAKPEAAPETGTQAAPQFGREAQSQGEWTPERIRTAVEQSPPALKDILRALASRPNQWISTTELAKTIQGNANADWKTVAGTLGAFRRRVRHRYGLQNLPFERRWDHAAMCKVNRMSVEMANIVMQALGDGGSYV